MPSVCGHLLFPACGCPVPKKKRVRDRSTGRPRGQPRSPWRLRKEADAQRQAELESRILAAVQEGKVDEILSAAEIALARISFSAFCRAAWHVVEPATHLEWGRHHELICSVLQALFEDWHRAKTERGYVPLVKNTVFNCPPGSLKSRLIAVFFQAWVWIRAPGTKFVCVSVNEGAALRDARDTRALLLSDWYQMNFRPPWTIKADQDAISDFGNTAGGGRISRPSGSVIVGLRGDFLLGDDLNDPEESDKQIERERVNNLWDTNQYNRVNDPLRSQRICVQQRVHVEDHTGHVIRTQGTWSLENREGWLQVVLPAEFETSRPGFAIPDGLRHYVEKLPGAEVRDWRTEPGEVLHPARMTPDWIAGEKRRWLGTSNYAGQMQQRPVDAGGGKIKRAWFNFFRLARGVRPGIDELETGRPRPADCHQGEAIVISAAHHRPGHWDFDQLVVSVDPAYKKTEKGSLWGMLVFGCKGARKFLLDDRSRRGEPDEAIAAMKSVVRTWLPDKILIEDKAGGAGMHRTLELAMAEGDCPMVELELVNPGTLDKDARVNAAIPALANGMLYLLDGAPWLEEYVEELSLYPNGMRNDRVDATTQAVNHIRIDDCTYPSASAWSRALAS